MFSAKKIFLFITGFYCRIISAGRTHGRHLVKMKAEEEFDFNLRLHRGVSIEKIDREQKTVFDSNGKVHHLRCAYYGHRQQGCYAKRRASIARNFHYAKPG